MKLLSQLPETFAKHQGVVAAFAVCVTCFALFSLTELQIDDNFNNVLRQSSDEASGDLEMESDDSSCVLLIRGGRILEAGNQGALRDLVVAVQEIENVEAVHSIFDARKPTRFGRYYLPLISGSPETSEELDQLQRQVLQHPLVKQKLLTSDGKETLVIVELAAKLQRAAELDVVIEEIRRTAEACLGSTNLTLGITGIPALQVEMTKAIKWEQIFFIAAGEGVGIIICLLIFRRLAALIIVQAAPLTAVIWSLGLMAFVGEPLDVINSVLAPLVLTIALADSVHLVMRIRSAREGGGERVAAVVEALKYVGPACFLTSVTTAIAFGSLRMASIEVIQRFGISCAMSVVAAFFAVITVVPVLACTSLGDHLTRPQKKRDLFGLVVAVWLDRIVNQRRVSLSVTALVLTLALLFVSARLEPNIQMRQFLPGDGSALKTLRHCDEAFDGLLPVYAVITWNESAKQTELLEALGAVEDLIDEESSMSAPLSILSVLKSLSTDAEVPIRSISKLKYLPEGKVNRLIRVDEKRAFVISRVRDVGTRNVIPVYEELRLKFNELEKRWPNLKIKMTGWTVSAGRLSESMLSDMMRSLYVAVLISLIVLVVAFRSWQLGLVCLIPNLFPLVATGATMVVFDVPLHWSSATVFSVCFGIAVDDTIHFLSSYTHELNGGAASRIAIRRTIHRVGEALVTSTLIMVCAFLVVTMSSVPSIREFASAFIVVLGWALVGDLLFLPAQLGLLKQFRNNSNANPLTD